jgi:hypothetical protein
VDLVIRADRAVIDGKDRAVGPLDTDHPVWEASV